MRKRFLAGMALLTAYGVLAVSALFCAIGYWQVSEGAQNELRERAGLLRDILNAGTPYEELRFIDMHMDMSVLTAEGAVYGGYPAGMDTEGMAGQSEVLRALETGMGESKRFSQGFQQEAYYCALKLNDGAVLRLSRPVSGLWRMFAGALPATVGVILLVLLTEYLLAQRLARRIMAPISKVDLTADLSAPYDEFAPFVLALERQQTNIEQHQADLQKRGETLKAITENMSEGVILVDSGGAVLSINKSAARIFAVETVIEGKNILEIVRDVVFLHHMRTALAGAHSEMVLEQVARLYQVLLSPAGDGGAVILFLDITEKDMAEKQRRDFSANVSHELKTPLTTIFGNAEMLADGMVEEGDRAHFYGRIKDEAARLMSLIEDIIKISRLDEGAGMDLWEDVDLSASAVEAMESLAEKAAEHSVTVTLEGEGAVVSANRAQMYELFLNLIDNAIAYNRPGGHVAVTITHDDRQAKIVVSDTGIGIPPEDQNRVFERFFRVDKSRSKKTGGTGLGLAIVKHIVSAHCGAVNIESRESGMADYSEAVPGSGAVPGGNLVPDSGCIPGGGSVSGSGVVSNSGTVMAVWLPLRPLRL